MERPSGQRRQGERRRLLDQRSPIARRLRRAFPDARVVAISGRPSYAGGLDPLAVAQGLGAVRTIRMPISRDQLLRIVEEVR
ncbi:MAG: hypothetical protein Q8Q85_05520 [Gemmatimonadales bacterium]|nr:hypothetical protein [Gemmatimonadales bacterium]